MYLSVPTVIVLLDLVTAGSVVISVGVVEIPGVVDVYLMAEKVSGRVGVRVELFLAFPLRHLSRRSDHDDSEG